MDALASKEIFYDYRLPNGRRVVIRQVPALYDPNDPEGECYFLPEVVDRLSDLIDIAASCDVKPGHWIEVDYKTGEAEEQSGI